MLCVLLDGVPGDSGGYACAIGIFYREKLSCSAWAGYDNLGYSQV